MNILKVYEGELYFLQVSILSLIQQDLNSWSLPNYMLAIGLQRKLCSSSPWIPSSLKDYQLAKINLLNNHNK